MNKSFSITLGAIWTIGLVMFGLWGWQRADAIVQMVGWEKQTIGAAAIKCMAVALVAAAQAVLLTLVVDRLYRRDALCDLLKLSAVFVFMVCMVCAIALGFAGR